MCTLVLSMQQREARTPPHERWGWNSPRVAGLDVVSPLLLLLLLLSHAGLCRAAPRAWSIFPVWSCVHSRETGGPSLMVWNNIVCVCCVWLCRCSRLQANTAHVWRWCWWWFTQHIAADSRRAAAKQHSSIQRTWPHYCNICYYICKIYAPWTHYHHQLVVLAAPHSFGHKRCEMRTNFANSGAAFFSQQCGQHTRIFVCTHSSKKKAHHHQLESNVLNTEHNIEECARTQQKTITSTYAIMYICAKGAS